MSDGCSFPFLTLRPGKEVLSGSEFWHGKVKQSASLFFPYFRVKRCTTSEIIVGFPFLEKEKVGHRSVTNLKLKLLLEDYGLPVFLS